MSMIPLIQRRCFSLAKDFQALVTLSQQKQSCPSLIPSWTQMMERILKDDSSNNTHLATAVHHLQQTQQHPQNPQLYDRMLQALAQAHAGDAALQVLHLWRRQFGGDWQHAPSIQAYHGVLQAHLQSPHAATVALEVLDYLNDVGYHWQPNTITHGLVCQCIAQSIQRHHWDNAWIAPLRTSLQHVITHTTDDRSTLISILESSLAALGKIMKNTSTTDEQQHQQLHDICQQAVQVWTELRHEFPLETQNSTAVWSLPLSYIQPLLQHEEFPQHLELSHYLTWIERAPNPIQHQLLRHMTQIVQASTDPRDWNTLLQACYTAGQYHQVWKHYRTMRNTRIDRDGTALSIVLQASRQLQTPQAAAQATSLLRNVLETPTAFTPSVDDYTTVLQAWSGVRSPSAAHQCDQILQLLQDHGVQPQGMHYQIAVTTWGYHRSEEAVAKILEYAPRVHHHSTVISALARTKTLPGAQAAHDYLNQTPSPTLQDYHAVLLAWNAIGSLEQVLATYDQLCRHHTPTSDTIRTLVWAWSKSDHPQAAAEAQAWLTRIEPDRNVYNSVLGLYATRQHNDPHQAQALYDTMQTLYQAGNLAVKPDAMSQKHLLRAWARSNEPLKAETCQAILQDMTDAYRHGDLDMRPDAYAYAAVLMACIGSTSSQAVPIALGVLARADNNEYTFALLLQVVGTHVEDTKERLRLAGMIFQSACQAGCVNDRVLAALQRHTPPLYRRLPQALPAEWSQNVNTIK